VSARHEGEEGAREQSRRYLGCLCRIRCANERWGMIVGGATFVPRRDAKSGGRERRVSLTGDSLYRGNLGIQDLLHRGEGGLIAIRTPLQAPLEFSEGLGFRGQGTGYRV